MPFEINGATPSPAAAEPSYYNESGMIHFPDSGKRFRGDGHSTTVGKPRLDLRWPTMSAAGAAYYYGLFSSDTLPTVELIDCQGYNPRTAAYTTYRGTEADDETGSSWGVTNHGISLVDGAAFLRVEGVDLSPFAGTEGTSAPYKLVMTDQASKVVCAYIGAADAAEALGGNKTVTGITKADPGVVTFQAGHGFTGGELIKWKDLTEMTELNGKYCTLANKSGDTFEIVDTSGYVAAETTGGVCANQVTDVGTDGVHLISTYNGSTRNWVDIESGFDYNDSAYTFEVLQDGPIMHFPTYKSIEFRGTSPRFKGFRVLVTELG